MSQPSRHRPSGNRQALLEGALHCLQERGYARTTARDIVAASETNLGAIGYHYGSTEQLLTRALLTGFERWFDELAQATTTVAEGVRPLVAVARELPRTFERNRPLARAFVEAVAQAEHSSEIRDGLRSCYERGHELLRAVVGEGPDADAVSSLLLAVFDGMLIQWLIGADRAAGSEELVRIGMALTDAANGAQQAPTGDAADL
ncbi:MAG TPA: TetR/AcrR family transcriptional regulator [Solirubrobacteraceae bacterium]|jgi:AcrR family transcriptional regulator